ncbi:hypothetical protein WJX84_011379 [Apatococcus fuscideae]|uniref:EGF-like domain-containing protein n=1 Tax=Apatococcus fuscideae TaxID=2026836 RepID=A0AAW1T1P2_9CHLO
MSEYKTLLQRPVSLRNESTIFQSGYKAPARDEACPGHCNGVCNAHTGTCTCQAGWKGRGCTEMAKRPCSNHYRATGSEPAMQPGRWSIPGWLANRYPDDSASSVAERLEMLGA